MPTTKIEGTPRKRRKPNNPKIIPEDQQIFKDLVFCEYFSQGFHPILTDSLDFRLLPQQ
jgi:hypothetical protein